MDTLARGRYQAAAKKLLKAFSGRAQSYGGGCCADLLLSSVSESEAWLQNFATLYDIVWTLVSGPLSPVGTGGSHTSHKSKVLFCGVVQQ